MTTYTNSGLVLSIQSAKGSPLTITAGTNAAPGVFTSVGHGLLDGAVVLVEMLGMVELNMRLMTIVNKATDTVQFKDADTGSVGIDTTDFGTFTSGTMTPITLGTTIPGVIDFSPSGGEIKKVDSTEVSDLRDKETVVGATATSYNMTMKWNPSATAQKAMNTAFTLREPRGFRIRWPDGRYCQFYGTVGYSGMPGGSSQGLTTTQASVSMEGDITNGIA